MGSTPIGAMVKEKTLKPKQAEHVVTVSQANRGGATNTTGFKPPYAVSREV